MQGTLLTRLAVLAALLFASFGMATSHAAAPAAADAGPMRHHAMPAAPCGESDSDSDRDRKSAAIDCMIACSAIPAPESAIERQTVEPGLVLVRADALEHDGRHPESDPPPPRSA